MLELISVSAKWFPTQLTLGYDADRPVSLNLVEGEWLAVLGENGSGKSTLLHAIAGTVPIVTGLIAVDGITLSQSKPVERFSAGVQHVPQHTSFALPIPIADSYNLLRHRRPALFNEAALADLHHEFRDVHGARQGMLEPWLFDLMLAIMSCPRVLLLDENQPKWPLAQRERAYEVIRSLVPQASVIVVEHDVRFAVDHVEKVLWLRAEPDKVPALLDAKFEPHRDLLFAAFRKDVEVLQGEPEVQGLDRLVDPEHAPVDELRMALRARGLKGQHLRDEEARLHEDFGFLIHAKAAGALSGGQRLILLALMLRISGLGSLPNNLLHHLDAKRTEKLTNHLRRYTDD